MHTTSVLAKIRATLLALVALFLVSCSQNRVQTRNLVVLLVDGCSTSSLSVARWYRYAVDSLPHQLNLDPYLCGLVDASNTVSPITGSSESMSAYMTGVRTGAGYVSVMPGRGRYGDMVEIDTARAYQPLATILEAAKARGKSTGMVVTVEYLHATPAACAAHSKSRYKRDAIACQIASQNLDLLYGGGRSYLSDDVRGILAENGTRLIEDDLEAFRACEDPRQWAIFSETDMRFEIDRDSSREPSLAEMTAKALGQLSKNSKGFFLMVEGSKVDYAAHANDPAAHIRDLLAFDDAVGEALDFARKDGNTTVIIVPDHGTAGMTIGAGRLEYYAAKPLAEHFGSIAGYKASAQYLSELIMAAPAKEVRGIMKEYCGIDITEEEEALLLENKNNATEDYMTAAYDPTLQGKIAQIMTQRTNIGYSSGTHTGEDLFLAIYHPRGLRPEGWIANTDLAVYMTEVLGMDEPLEKLSSLFFCKASELFEGYECSVEGETLTVRSAAHSLSIPANRSWVMVDSLKTEIPSVTVMSEGEFYVNRCLKKLL
ncbi:MAG: alkaline phosphatase [Candidatus Cryptobacteroides sp.]